jgi:predicted methyltransferase
MQQNTIVLSYIQAEQMLAARQRGESSMSVSSDLGISEVTVQLDETGVDFPNGEQVSWRQLQHIKESTTSVFEVSQEILYPIQHFSEHTNRMCSLMPTRRTPTMLIAGFTMHRIVDIDPMEDTLKKIATIGPLRGNVLDTATGLGYTAIEAARTAAHVTTIELDPGAQEIARHNPWSRQLFNNPKIEQMMGDTYEVITTFPSESFDRIVHDPPVFSLAGELYSGVFYRELHRVLKRGGRVFHYIGDLNSKSAGTVTRGALKRLGEAGFSRIERRPEAFGVVMYK